MRVIENNYSAHTEYEKGCPRCNSKFAFSFGDLKMDSVTLSHYVECPCCGFSIPLNSEKIDSEETPTINTVQYPRDFLSFPDDLPVATNIEDTKINEWIKECVNNLDEDSGYSCIQTGDTMVFAFAYKSDEGLPVANVVVTKNFQEAVVKIPRKIF